MQDVSHGGAVVAFIAEAARAGQYWTQADMNALSATLTEVVWPVELGGTFHYYVDGTSARVDAPDPPSNDNGNSLPGRLHEWLHLGRERVDIQQRIERDYANPGNPNTVTFFGYQAIGIAALNARVLTTGSPVY
jgi:hypothetical protein